MKKTVLIVTLWVTLLGAFRTSAQDFSNKGKDFWVGYGLHCRMFSSGGGSQEMVLYFATEAITTVTVEIPGVGYTQTFSNIAANTIFTTPPMPKNGPFDARLTTEGIHNTGIHIMSDKPIVAYAHIYNGNVSGATLLFPTNTLGKEYYSINFEQHSNEPNSNSFFYAVATDTGTTTIEVIPSEATQKMAAGQAYSFDLTQGQVLNVMGVLTNANNGVDLTGSIIRSISKNNSGCKRIGVFSGSGKINIHCPLGPSGNSADNYMVQAFPKNAWGKYYLTVPTQNFENNFFRIAVSDPTTVVKLNGMVLTGLINGFYYHFGTTNTPNVIEADKPVMVAQYITSESQCGNGNTGDPEVIYLSPVEQNINKVILNSTQNFAITQHFINVVIPNSGTAVSSFTIDGSPPGSVFISHPRNAAYAYIQLNVSPGQHTLQSDSGFNAIAYGYGSAESYGYNAGSNVKDLYQFISVQNQYATVNFPAGCKNSPFYFYMTFPYQPTQINWQFSGLFTDVIINNPVYDSSWVVNGRQLYRYKLPNSYIIPNSGTYPIRVVAQNPITVDGCGGEQEIDYDLQVFDRPSADFSFTNNGCASDTVFFIDNSSTGGRSVVKWNWDFDDGTIDSVKNTKHRYLTAGSFDVKHSLITDVGCISDTAIKTIVLNDPPVAQFNVSSPACIGKPISFTDLSTPNAGTTLVKWYWNFGDGSPAVIANSNIQQSHTYNTAGSFTVSLTVETSTGCRSFQLTKSVFINVSPLAAFSFPNVCLPSGTTQFTDHSTISDGTQNLFTYQWNFGDGGTATIKNPVHTYSNTGPFNVTLTVVSNNGCTDDSLRVMNTIFSPPQAIFTAPADVCLGQVVNFTDQSTAPNSSITQWQWNFGDGTISVLQNPSKTYSNSGSYTVSLTVLSAEGCPSTVTTRLVIINPLPTAAFNIAAPTCVGQNITITDASTVNPGNLVKWTWDYGDGTNAVLTNGLPIIHSYSATNTYNVTLQVESNKGCKSAVMSRPARINPLPVAGFSMPENCLNDPFSQFTDTSKIADGTQSQFTYLWNFDDPNANVANPNTSTGKNPQHRYTAANNYNVSLTVTSNNGCASSVTKTFTVNGAAPQSVFTVQNGNSKCSNEDVTIINNSTVDFGNIVKLEIFWDFGNNPGSKIVDDDPQGDELYSFRYPEFGTPATKSVSIRVIAYSGINCFNISTQVITLQATPTITFNAINGICADIAPFQLTQASEVNNMSGTGTFTGPGISSSGLFDPFAATPGTHTIRYTFASSNGCINFKEQTVQVFPVPTANAGPDRFMLEGGNITLLGSGSGAGALSYLWKPPTALNSTTIANPKATPTSDIFYTLQVTSREGCSDTDVVFVKVLLAPVIPNAFSPNGDGINDKWDITSLESYPGCTVEVYNRYGQIVYRSVGYSKPWDGTFSNKPVPAGTYYYIVNPKNGRQQLAGFVDVLR